MDHGFMQAWGSPLHFNRHLCSLDFGFFLDHTMLGCCNHASLCSIYCLGCKSVFLLLLLLPLLLPLLLLYLLLLPHVP